MKNEEKHGEESYTQTRSLLQQSRRDELAGWEKTLEGRKGPKLIEVWRATPEGKTEVAKERPSDQAKDIRRLGAEINWANDRAVRKKLVYEDSTGIREVTEVM